MYPIERKYTRNIHLRHCVAFLIIIITITRTLLRVHHAKRKHSMSGSCSTNITLQYHSKIKVVQPTKYEDKP